MRRLQASCSRAFAAAACIFLSSAALAKDAAPSAMEDPFEDKPASTSRTAGAKAEERASSTARTARTKVQDTSTGVKRTAYERAPAGYAQQSRASRDMAARETMPSNSGSARSRSSGDRPDARVARRDSDRMAEELLPEPSGDGVIGGAHETHYPDQYHGEPSDEFSPIAGNGFDDGRHGDFSGAAGCCDDFSYCRNRWCGPIYARGEYLAWWVKGGSTPPLLTTGPSTAPRAQAGVLGQPGTSVLFGDERLNTDMRSGGRVTLGVWVNPCTRIEGSYFQLGDNVTNFSTTSNGSAILARPFFNVQTGAQDSNVVAFPGQLSGSATVRSTSTFLGSDIRLLHNICFRDYCGDRQFRIDFLVGYRFLRLSEGLTVSSTTTSNSTAVPVPVGTVFGTSDSFGVTNNFNGGEVGIAGDFRYCRWSFLGTGRLAIGDVSENVSIGGSTTVAVPGSALVAANGGLLALPSNSGNFQRNTFTVVPSLELKLGYDITPRLRALVGYDLIYWSKVARPGDQIDTTLNTSQASGQPLAGASRPAFVFRESDLWVQGLSVGGEFRF